MNGIRGIPDLELAAGDYLITPSEMMRSGLGAAQALLSGDVDEDDLASLYQIETATGELAVEVGLDPRVGGSDAASSGLLGGSKAEEVLAFRPPGGDAGLTVEKGGFLARTYTFRSVGEGLGTDGAVLATFEASALPFRGWTLVEPDGTTAASVGTEGLLPDLLGHPTYVATAPDGTEVARVDVERRSTGGLIGGEFYEAAVTLPASSIPPAVGLAVAFGLLRTYAESSGTSGDGGDGGDGE
jgi:hypothetical protein